MVCLPFRKIGELPPLSKHSSWNSVKSKVTPSSSPFLISSNFDSQESLFLIDSIYFSMVRGDKNRDLAIKVAGYPFAKRLKTSLSLLDKCKNLPKPIFCKNCALLSEYRISKLISLYREPKQEIRSTGLS